MNVNWRMLAIPLAGLIAASLMSGQAGPAHATGTSPLTEGTKSAGAKETAGLRVALRGEADKKAKVKDAEDRDGAGKDDADTRHGIDGDKIARDVEEAVSDAVADVAQALEDLEADIRVELDGEKLDAMSEEYRETLDEVRERLRDAGDRLAEHAEDVEVRVTRAGEAAVKAAKKAGKTLREKRVIVLRAGKDATIEIEKDDRGRTVVVIEGDNVKVITREKPGKVDRPNRSPE